jgi:hypothetical protein
VLESAMAFHQSAEDRFAAMAKWRMAKVMRKRDGFREVLVKLQCPRNTARHGRELPWCASGACADGRL